MQLPAISLSQEQLSRFDEAVKKEWIVTNGLGGYASSTVTGLNTRKYHGLLVAALHPPGDRTVCLMKLDEQLVLNHESIALGINEFNYGEPPEDRTFLKGFTASPFPSYHYVAGNIVLTKTVLMPTGKNLVAVLYNTQNFNDSTAILKITPLLTCRHFHDVVDRQKKPLTFNQTNEAHSVALFFTNPKAAVILKATSGRFNDASCWVEHLFYREEYNRGESSVDDGYQPGYFELEVQPRKTADFAIVAVAEESNVEAAAEIAGVGDSYEAIEQLFDAAHSRNSRLLVDFYSRYKQIPITEWLSLTLLAADAFVVESKDSRVSIIAGYHWFEAWGRDAFISLPGLLLVTGRFNEARNILLTFADLMKEGLIPNCLEDKSCSPYYNTADATLWYVNAAFQYLKYTMDFAFVQEKLWEKIKAVLESYTHGTVFGIRMDSDGLIVHGPRLTWMDAEVDGTPVTPRAGKAVEVQALWYNALKIAELLAGKFGEKNLAEDYAKRAETVRTSFNRKFWNEKNRCLYDVVEEDGADASMRPNQVIAVSLDFTMLDAQKSLMILNTVENALLTPYGLRTLGRNDPRYVGAYVGDRRSRDRAYHNGAVWPWLLGPFTTACAKVKFTADPEPSLALGSLVTPLLSHQIYQAGLGTISEIFDGDPPYTPRGCIAQAWSVAEPLRAYVEDVMHVRPKFEVQVL
jgi:predicted glycogen debranching enzyme